MVVATDMSGVTAVEAPVLLMKVVAVGKSPLIFFLMFGGLEFLLSFETSKCKVSKLPVSLSISFLLQEI